MIRKKKSYMLGEELIHKGLATLEQVDQALEIQKETKEFIGQILVRFGFISEDKLVEILADQFELPLVNPAKMSVPAPVLKRVPPKVAHHYHVFPIQTAGDKLTLA